MPEQNQESSLTSNNLAGNNREALDEQSLKRIIEALIFASDKPVSIQQMKDIIGDVDARLIRKLVNDLKQEYRQSERSFGISEVAGGFQFLTEPAYSRWLKKLYKIKQSDYLTGPSLETLAIIAYRQPVAKADIEFIRGVNVDGVISNLLEKGMIRITGRKEVVGRPFLYGTTNQFLQYFGLNSLDELPALPEFKEADLNFQKKDNITIEPAQELAQELPLDDKTPTNNGGIRDGESKEVTP